MDGLFQNERHLCPEKMREAASSMDYKPRRQRLCFILFLHTAENMVGHMELTQYKHLNLPKKVTQAKNIYQVGVASRISYLTMNWV